MPNRKTAYWLMVGVCFVSCSAFAAEQCEGQAPLPHNMGAENFVTTSRVYKGNGVETYETCVENRGTGDLWVNWLIPGPTTWLLPGTAIPQPRPFIKRDSIDANGCLEYGNVGAIMRVPYLGHASDADALGKEKSAGCAAAVSASYHDTELAAPKEIDAPIRLFVPSDKHNPSNTMLEFRAVATARWDEEPQTYEVGVAYSLSPVEGRSAGNPDVMTIRMSPGPIASYLMDNLKGHNIFEGITLGYKNEIDLQFFPTTKPVLRSAKYEILDQNHELVGAFMAPTWGPQ